MPSPTTSLVPVDPPAEADAVPSPALRAALRPLERQLADPAVTDILVNGHRSLWVDRGAGLEPEEWDCPDERRLREWATHLVSLGGRHVDEATPCVDVRLGELRVHVVLPPVAGEQTHVSIRVARTRVLDLDELDAAGMLAGHRARLEEAVRARSGLLITGAAGSGKTTLLAALLSRCAIDERIVVVEDVRELRIPHPHVVALEARQPNLEGAGGISMAELVRQSLRMRPDRLVVGECRGAEIRDLLTALNTGHEGGAGTLHANALDDVPARLEAMAALAGLEPRALARQAVSAFDLVVHLERRGGSRRIADVGRLVLGDHGTLTARVERARS
ncbi:TadA family conjugal transfer-associated ATPase [Cnuibacter sp. UC19_7]|uniref:TadA family conjugal transfer-associated ATPase n=1 Tax=Cnuibacter sp. UC19_7 TaxID=3350166 RepID=UPI00366E4101